MPGAWFDACEGSYTVQKPPHATVMTPENARLMNDFVECDVRCLAEIGLNRTQRSAFLEALLAYYGYHLDAIHAVQSVRISARGVLTGNRHQRTTDFSGRRRRRALLRCTGCGSKGEPEVLPGTEKRKKTVQCYETNFLQPAFRRHRMDGCKSESARNQNSGPESGRTDRGVLSVEDASGFDAAQSTLLYPADYFSPSTTIRR